MELNEKTLKNLEENVNGMVNKHVFNNVWKDVVISLISEVRLLRKKYGCKSDSEQLKIPKTTKEQRVQLNEGYNKNNNKMEEVKLTKEQEILFEVYDKGVQNEDCDLDAYVEKMKQTLSIAFVNQQRELLNALADNFNESTHTYVGQPMIEETLKAFNCG